MKRKKGGIYHKREDFKNFSFFNFEFFQYFNLFNFFWSLLFNLELDKTQIAFKLNFLNLKRLNSWNVKCELLIFLNVEFLLLYCNNCCIIQKLKNVKNWFLIINKVMWKNICEKDSEVKPGYYATKTSKI